MKKERLTKEEQDLLLKFKNDRIGLVCGDENRELAESSISQFYDLIGKSKPNITWSPSPIASEILLNALVSKGLSGNSYAKEFSYLLTNSVREDLEEIMKKDLGARWKDTLGNCLDATLKNSLDEPLLLHLKYFLKNTPVAEASDFIAISLCDSLKELGLEAFFTYFGGSFDSYWISYYKFCGMLGVEYLSNLQKRLSIVENISKSCGFWYPYENICIITMHPEKVNIDKEGYLRHNDDPVLEYRDGWKVYRP